MNVALAGPEGAPPVIMTHGFPESHRTRRELVPLLSDGLRLAMPDLRGFGDSDRPQDVADYATDKLIADIFALADALGIDRFALVGRDWGRDCLGGCPARRSQDQPSRDRQFAASADFPEEPDRG